MKTVVWTDTVQGAIMIIGLILILIIVSICAQVLFFMFNVTFSLASFEEI